MTVPIAVRKTLAIGPKDRVVFTIHEGGRVEVAKAEAEHTDPIVGKYLAFLERDMNDRPEKLSVLTRDKTMRELLRDVETEDFDLSS